MVHKKKALMEMETMVKGRPILFSKEMAQAILDGRKTQARQVYTINGKPSVHLPHIELEITKVRVERVQDISEDDARAEGCVETRAAPGLEIPMGDGWTIQNMGACASPAGNFQILWNSLHEKHGHGWDVNPYVWVVEFKMLNQ